MTEETKNPLSFTYLLNHKMCIQGGTVKLISARMATPVESRIYYVNYEG